MADFGDRGDIAKEPEEPQVALLRPRGGIVDGGPDRPAQLLFDLPDELLDPGGYRRRLLTLDCGQGRLGRLVREVKVDQAADQKHAGDETRDDDDVLPD